MRGYSPLCPLELAFISDIGINSSVEILLLFAESSLGNNPDEEYD
jgi:hypothetical protein